MTKLTHLMELLITLQYKELTTASELSQILEVNKKTIYRYINTLTEANIPIKTKKGRYGGFYLDNSFFIKQIKLDKEEIQALIMAADILSESNKFIYGKQLRNAVSKIKTEALNENVQLKDLKPAYEFSIKNAGNIEELDNKISKINLSIIRQRIMEITYFSLNKNSYTKFKIEPYSLIYRNGQWVIIGFSSLYNEVSAFLVSRVKKIKIIDDVFMKPVNFSIEEYMDKQWEQLIGTKKRVVIRFSYKVSELIKDTRWHPHQSIYNDENGNIVFQVYVEDYEEIKKWVLGFGVDAEIIEPLDLREELSYETQKMAEYYRKSCV